MYDKLCQEASEIQNSLTSKFLAFQADIQQDLVGESEGDSNSIQETTEDETFECIQDDDTQFDIIEEEAIVTESEELEEPTNVFERPEVAISYNCSICLEKFEKNKDYQSHIRFAHLPEDAEFFICLKCNNSKFTSENDLALHNAIAHREGEDFVCPTCNKVFASRTLLTRHFAIHTSSIFRPYVCSECGKSFFHYSSFHAHKKSHADIRDYSCTECSKAFRSLSHLNRHRKTHTKSKHKIHECSDCGKKFSERYNLTAHMNTHLGISRKKCASTSTA